MQSPASGGGLATRLLCPRVHAIAPSSGMEDRMDDGEQKYPKRRSNGGRWEGHNSIAVVAAGKIIAIVLWKCRRVHRRALDGRLLWR